MCLFGSAIINKPEGLLDAKFTKRGKIVHHFCSLSLVSIIFIEVKKDLVWGKGKLDVIAQVLAESAGRLYFLSLFLIKKIKIKIKNKLLPFNDTANNISLRLSKLKASTLGACSCYPLRWGGV